MDPSPSPTSPPPPKPVLNIKAPWAIGLVLVLLVGWILAGFFGFSKKKVEDEFKAYKGTHSEGSTFIGYKEVAGKAYPVTIYKSKSDTFEGEEKKHKETVWKSGVAFGGAISPLTGQKMIYGNPDIFGFGPGSIQGFSSYEFPSLVKPEGDLFLGGGYRILF